jgi:hypothetical protein
MKNSKEYNKKNYKKYWWNDKAKKDRASRNTARNRAIASGKAAKGDGKEVHHKNWKPQDNRPSNTAVVTRKYNRQDWAKKANKSKGSGYSKAKTIKTKK